MTRTLMTFFHLFPRFLAIVLFSLFVEANGYAQTFGSSASAFGEEAEFLKVEQAYQVVPSIHKKIELLWSIAPGYYLYQHQFKLEARNAETAEAIDLTFEEGKLKFDDYFQKELTVYYTSTNVHAELPTIALPFELKITSQGCADAGLCYPPRHQYFSVAKDGTATEIDASQFASSQPASNASTASRTAKSSNEAAPLLPLVLLGALFGGLILNLMPCVFPVLSLKALSFASSHLSKHSQHVHGWAYTAGVVISFIVAAGVILAARSAGELLGWGFQLQQPGFVAAMVFLFFLMGLSLSGFFHFGTSLMGTGQNLTTGHGLGASFFTGVLAALVASPCTAPFMASALGFALTQPTYIALLIFATLGFGMALPFLLLSYMPKLAERLPRPGPWMETLKEILAFPLYLTCIWLVWVLARQTGVDGAALILIALLALTFAIWLFQQTASRKGVRYTAKLAGALCVAFALGVLFRIGDFSQADAKNGPWEPYSASRLAELRAEDTAVFIDLTADWCITCKFNERVALNTDDVIKFAALNDIIMLQGDWTNEDPEISALLEEFERSGVPLYLMYPANGNEPPVVLPQILSKSMVLKAMEESLR